jgi:hypothetical protein
MRVVIHQPYFLPWIGYFCKLAWADGLIILDDAQFRKRHFHDRARILNMHGEDAWVSIPTGQNLGKRICDVYAKELGFPDLIEKTLHYSYARAAGYTDCWERVHEWITAVDPRASLADINIALMKRIIDAVLPERSLQVWRSSAIHSVGDTTDRLIDLMTTVGASELLIGSGGSLASGVHDFTRFPSHGLSLFVQNVLAANIEYPQYRRTRGGFVAGLSVVDALFNVGTAGVRELLRRPMLTPQRMM